MARRTARDRRDRFGLLRHTADGRAHEDARTIRDREGFGNAETPFRADARRHGVEPGGGSRARAAARALEAVRCGDAGREWPPRREPVTFDVKKIGTLVVVMLENRS